MAKSGKKEITETVNENGEVETMQVVAEDSKGNTYLPTAEPLVVKEVKSLIEKAREVETDLKPAFAIARDALTQGKRELAELAHENITEFTAMSDGTLVYEFDGIRIEIIQTKEVIKTKIVEGVDEED